MKKLLIGLIALALLGFIFCGLTNLVLGIPVAESYSRITLVSPEMKRAKEILGAKCLMCHSQQPTLPFYAKLPGVRTLIGGHIEAGTNLFDLEELLSAQGANEVLLAKLEQTLTLNTMPIRPFLALHWNGQLSNQEKDDLLTWIHQVRESHYSTGLAAPEFVHHPIQPLPSKWPGGINPEKAELGNLLYHDRRLSGDNTLSCASCHGLDQGGTDNAQFSSGVRGQLGGINAPTSFNAMFNVRQFWDGRAADLAEQAGGPPLNPIEMDTSWKQVIGKLSKDAALTARYQATYATDEWSAQNITDAIAEFERTLITPNSPLDQYLKGDSSALTDREKEGLALFREHSCATCHSGKAMGGQSFERAVDPVVYYKFRGIEPGNAEFGRVNATGNENDRYKLKVPLLRNIAITGPYLHDGNLTDLSEVIPLMNRYFVPKLNRKKLSDDDVEKIKEMLLKNTGILNGQIQ